MNVARSRFGAAVDLDREGFFGSNREDQSRNGGGWSCSQATQPINQSIDQINVFHTHPGMSGMPVSSFLSMVFRSTLTTSFAFAPLLEVSSFWYLRQLLDLCRAKLSMSTKHAYHILHVYKEHSCSAGTGSLYIQYTCARTGSIQLSSRSNFESKHAAPSQTFAGLPFWPYTYH